MRDRAQEQQRSAWGRLHGRDSKKRWSDLESMQTEMADILWVTTGTAIYHRLLRFPEATRKAAYSRYVFSDGAGCHGYAYTSTQIQHRSLADQDLCAQVGSTPSKLLLPKNSHPNQSTGMPSSFLSTLLYILKPYPHEFSTFL